MSGTFLNRTASAENFLAHLCKSVFGFSPVILYCTKQSTNKLASGKQVVRQTSRSPCWSPQKCEGLAPLLAMMFPSSSFVTGFCTKWCIFSLFNLYIKTRRKKLWSVLSVMTWRCLHPRAKTALSGLVFFSPDLAKSDWHVYTCSKSGLSGSSWKVHPLLLLWHFIYVPKVSHFHGDGPHDGLDDWKTGGADWLSISKWTEVHYSGSLEVRGASLSPLVAACCFTDSGVSQTFNFSCTISEATRVKCV